MHPITKTIEKFVPDAKLLEQRGESEIVYILPTRYFRSKTNISIDFLRIKAHRTREVLSFLSF